MDQAAPIAESKESPDLALQEQPGGRIYLVDGVPFSADSVQAETNAAFSRLWNHYGYLGPLLEAAIINGNAGVVSGVAVITPWGSDVAKKWEDKTRHDAYVAHVKGVLAEQAPWLWPLFEGSDASLVIAPAGVCFSLGSRPGVQWDVPGLLPYVALAPFAEDGEAKH